MHIFKHVLIMMKIGSSWTCANHRIVKNKPKSLRKAFYILEELGGKAYTFIHTQLSHNANNNRIYRKQFSDQGKYLNTKPTLSYGPLTLKLSETCIQEQLLGLLHKPNQTCSGEENRTANEFKSLKHINCKENHLCSFHVFWKALEEFHKPPFFFSQDNLHN